MNILNKLIIHLNEFGSLPPSNIPDTLVTYWDRLVTYWNGFGSLLPLNIPGQVGYALEWVGFGSLLPLNILDTMVKYWNGFGSISDPFECISRTLGLSSSTPAGCVHNINSITGENG